MKSDKEKFVLPIGIFRRSLNIQGRAARAESKPSSSSSTFQHKKYPKEVNNSPNFIFIVEQLESNYRSHSIENQVDERNVIMIKNIDK